LRRVTLIVIFVSGVIIAAMLAVMFFFLATFDINAHKDKLLAFISEGIDRDVSIGGKIGLELSLNPKIVAGHVRIGNPSWSAGPYFAEAKHLETQVALLPLLVRQLKILTFRISGAAVHLETNQEGDPNWRMTWRGRPVKPRIKLLADIPHINVENSTLAFHGHSRPGIVLSIGALEGNLNLHEPFKLTGNLTYKELPLSLSFTGERLENGEKPFDIRFTAPDADIHAQGVYNPQSTPPLCITLENNVVDLSTYIKHKDKPIKSVPTTPSAPGTQRKIPNFIPNDNILNGLNMEVQINDLQVVYEDAEITSINTRLSIIDGKLLMSPWQSRSPSGSSINAGLLWDTSVSPPLADLSLEMDDLDYGLILNNLDIRDDIVGKLDMRIKVSGQGSSFHDFLGTADGEVEIVLDKGRTPRRVLELWSDGLIRFLIPTTWFEEDLTDLNCAVGRFEIENGVIRSNLLLSDTPRITVAGETVLDLKTEQVSCLFEPKNKEAVLLRYGRPIKVSGTLSDLKAEPVGSNIIALGKLALGLSYPASIILLFGDLGTTETNPCEALLHQELHNAGQSSGVGQ